MGSALSGKGGFELRVVVKPLALFCRHLALLALCHLLLHRFGVVVTQVRTSLTIFELSSVTSSWSESSLKFSTAFKTSFQNESTGKVSVGIAALLVANA
jgi:hypothetical protein